MCTSKPKVPKETQETPPVLMTARDDQGASDEATPQGRKKLRIDLNNATATPYGSSLVIPT